MNDRAQQTITDVTALVETIQSNHVAGRRRLVGIVGAPGAGKTHLARYLQRTVRTPRIAIVPMDGFHLANETLVEMGRRDHKGRPDTYDVAGFVNLLERLDRRDAEVVYVPRFVREIEEPIAGALAVRPDAELVIVEGNYLLLDEPPWDAVAGWLDHTYYLDTPEPLRIRRLFARQRQTYGEVGARDWIDRVDRPNSAIVESTKGRAEFLVEPFQVDGEPLH